MWLSVTHWSALQSSTEIRKLKKTTNHPNEVWRPTVANYLPVPSRGLDGVFALSEKLRSLTVIGSRSSFMCLKTKHLFNSGLNRFLWQQQSLITPWVEDVVSHRLHRVTCAASSVTHNFPLSMPHFSNSQWGTERTVKSTRCEHDPLSPSQHVWMILYNCATS